MKQKQFHSLHKVYIPLAGNEPKMRYVMLFMAVMLVAVLVGCAAPPVKEEAVPEAKPVAEPVAVAAPVEAEPVAVVTPAVPAAPEALAIESLGDIEEELDFSDLDALSAELAVLEELEI